MNSIHQYYRKSEDTSVLPPQGFDPNKVHAPYQDWDIVLAHWSKKRLLAALGWTNKLIWKLTTAAGALIKEGEGKHRVDGSALKSLVRAARLGFCEIRFKLKGITEYLGTHWQGAASDRKTVRSIRSDMAALGLFEMDGEGCAGSTFVPMMVGIDFEMLLLFYRHMERFYLLKAGGSIEALPEHRGSNVVRLFEAVFAGRLTYGHGIKAEEPEREEDKECQVLWTGDRWLTLKELEEQEFAWTEEGMDNWMGGGERDTSVG